MLFVLAILISFIFPLSADTVPLFPQTPIVVMSGLQIQTPVMITSSNSVYLVVSMGSNGMLNGLVSSYSTNGTTWSSPAIAPTDSYTGTWINGITSGVLATYIAPSIGYSTAAPYAKFANSMGTSWGTTTLIESSSTIVTPVIISSVPAGFLATWNDASDHNPYASFSSDQGSTWTTPVQINNFGAINSAVAVSGNSAGFLATWVDNARITNTAFSSFSSDNGTTWGVSTIISMTNHPSSDVFVAGNSSGFMAVWADNTHSAYSTFTANNGTTWSTPSLISSMNVLTGTDIFVSGGSDGFVASWIQDDHNAYASLSADNGTSWSSPVQITSDGSVSGSNTDGAKGFVCVGVFGSNCIFSWNNDSQNAVISFSEINGSGLNAPSHLSGTQNKNNFGLQYEFYNHLQWNPSPSLGVAGYYVYKNGVKIATLSAATHQYDDHNQEKGASTLYSITAFNGSNNESSPVTITID